MRSIRHMEGRLSMLFLATATTPTVVASLAPTVVIALLFLIAAAVAVVALVAIAESGFLMRVERRVDDGNVGRREKLLAYHHTAIKRLFWSLSSLIVLVLVIEACPGLKGVLKAPWTPLLTIHLAGFGAPFLVLFAIARRFDGDRHPRIHWRYAVPCVAAVLGAVITGGMLLSH